VDLGPLEVPLIAEKWHKKADLPYMDISKGFPANCLLNSSKRSPYLLIPRLEKADIRRVQKRYNDGVKAKHEAQLDNDKGSDDCGDGHSFDGYLQNV
jgi:hypothetical protein